MGVFAYTSPGSFVENTDPDSGGLLRPEKSCQVITVSPRTLPSSENPGNIVSAVAAVGHGLS
jgi:hypothetical protein